jgi:hypothetical protein
MPPARSFSSNVTRAVLLVAAAVALSACSGSTKGRITTIEASTAAPSGGAGASSTAVAPSAAGAEQGTDSALTGLRRVIILPVPSFESILGIDENNNLEVMDADSSSGLFVFTPVGDKYLIQTANAGSGDEPDCMRVKANGSSALRVGPTACDAGKANQLFTVTPDKKDGKGNQTYAISNRSAFLQVFDEGLIAEELGDAPLATTFRLVDRGKANLPVLD